MCIDHRVCKTSNRRNAVLCTDESVGASRHAGVEITAKQHMPYFSCRRGRLRQGIKAVLSSLSSQLAGALGWQVSNTNEPWRVSMLRVLNLDPKG